MKVLYNDIKPIELDYPAKAVAKADLYARSDIITVHTPLTGATRRLINAEAIAQFKHGAQFVNAARGPIVDYAALAEAINSGHISAATIDCHDPEPMPQDYPMFRCDPEKVILTPHVAARVPEAMDRMCDVVYDVVAVLKGHRPTWPAEPDQYG
jgi:phosphoglycerate dehydrogenase-like enzyme